jgi:hypothetical protein
MINATATTTEIPRAFSGLGNFFLLNFNNRFQFQIIPLLLKEKVYTPRATISPLVTSKTEMHIIKKLMIIQFRTSFILF